MPLVDIIVITTTNVLVTAALNVTMVFVPLVLIVEEDVQSTVTATKPLTALTV